MLQHPSLPSPRRRAHPPHPKTAHGRRSRSRSRRRYSSAERAARDNTHEQIEARALGGMRPLVGSGQHTPCDGPAEPREVLEDLLLHLFWHERARAHKRRRDRLVRMHVRVIVIVVVVESVAVVVESVVAVAVVVRGELPEHPGNALIIRRRLAQHGLKVRHRRTHHIQRGPHRARVEPGDGAVARVPLEGAEERALARHELRGVLHGGVRDAAEPGPALVDALRGEEERGGERHHGPVEQDAQRGGVGCERVAWLREGVPAEVAVAVESEREGHGRGVRVLLLAAVAALAAAAADEDEVVPIPAEECGVRGLAGW